MSEHKTTNVKSNQPSATSYCRLLIATTTFSCPIGLTDFALHELWGHPSRVLDYVLYKPAFIAFSSLLIHLMIVTAIACLLVGGLIALRCILMRLTGSFVGLPPLATVSAVLTALFLASLRLLKESPPIPSTVIFLTLAALFGAILLAMEQRSSKPFSRLNRPTRRAYSVMLAVNATVFVVAFLAPDLNMLLREKAGRPAPRSPQRPNVVLIVLDTVRADRLSCYGSATVATPNIDRLARGGLTFLNAFSTAPWTVPSHASMFTGLYPSQHQATWDNTSLRDEFVTLAERLTESGYKCAGFSENPFVGVANGFSQGFTEFHETWRRPLFERAVIKLLRALGHRFDLEYAPRTTSLLSRWLTADGREVQPFFVFVNLMAAHLPNYPRPGHGPTHWPDDVLAKIEPINQVPERYYLPQYRLTESELSAMSDIYDQQVAYLDGHVGHIMTMLEDHRILDDTIVVLTSDHGENFGEHGYIEHQFCLYNTLIRIPLILHYPRVIVPTLVHETVSNVAITDTILRLSRLAVKDSERISPHSSLHEVIENQPIFAEYSNSVAMLRRALGHEASVLDFVQFDRDLQCILENDFKYIWSSNGKYELYSMSEDFDEASNLVDHEPAIANALLHGLETWRQAHPAPDAGVAPPVDAATRDALRTLGYEQ